MRDTVGEGTSKRLRSKGLQRTTKVLFVENHLIPGPFSGNDK